MGCGFTNVHFFEGGAFFSSLRLYWIPFLCPYLLSWLYSKNRWLPYPEEGLMSTNEILSAMSHSSEGYWEPTRRAAASPASFIIISSETHSHCVDWTHKSMAVCSVHCEWQQRKTTELEIMLALRT